MRITNAITSNNLLLNLQKNATILDKLQYQAATGNKIQFASDNPIIAGRSLKFRTSLAETNQYLQNAESAVSWLSLTATAVSNIRESFFAGESSVRSRLVSASTGTNTIADMKKYLGEIEELMNGAVGEANATYAGRYVLSGYRTDEPPFFESDKKNENFSIIERFSPNDIAQKEIFTKNPTDNAHMPQAKNVYFLQLAYDKGFSDFSGLPVTAKKSAVDADAYSPGANEIFFIEDTGELIFGQEAYENALASGGEIAISYTKSGFLKGDVNPAIYFECENLTNGKQYAAPTDENQAMRCELGTSNQMQINTLAKNVVPIALLNELKDIIRLAGDAKISEESDVRAKFSALGYSGVALEDLVKQQLTDENKVYTDVLAGRLTKLIGKMDNNSELLSNTDTMLGSRINRVNLIEQRLADDRINFESLKVANDSVDMDEVLIRLSSQLSVYSSALQVGSKLMQMSLVNFS